MQPLRAYIGGDGKEGKKEKKRGGGGRREIERVVAAFLDKLRSRRELATKDRLTLSISFDRKRMQVKACLSSEKHFYVFFQKV